jgi:hypothetical protein
MELEEIKSFLQKEVIKIHSSAPVEILAIIRKKSAGNINRLLQHIRLEIYMAIFFLATAIVMTLVLPGLFVRLIAAGISIYILFFIRYLAKLSRQVKNYQNFPVSTRSAILNITQLMDRFIQLYFICCMLIIPVLFTISLSFFFNEHPGFRANPLELFRSPGFLSFLAGFFAWGAFMYFFSRWYIQKVYGQYLHELKILLQELNAT